MWNSVIQGVKVQNESLDPRLQFNKTILKCYFEQWKNSTKDKTKNGHLKKKKEVSCVEQKKIATSSWHFVDLNKTLLQNEIELLWKFWCFWKESVKSNERLSRTRNIKSKHKYIKKSNMIGYQSTKLVYQSSEIEQCTDAHQEVLKKYFNLWKGNTYSPVNSGTSAMCDKNANNSTDTTEVKNSETMCVPDSKGMHNDRPDMHILHNYLNLWRAIKNDHGTIKNKDIPTRKIDKFLTAIQAAKMKAAKKHKSSQSMMAANFKRRKPQDRDSSNINYWGGGDTLNSSQNPVPVTVNQSKQEVDVNGTMESIYKENSTMLTSMAKELNTSLKEAHSLLESTITSAFQGNHTRRKHFRSHNKTPVSLQMPDSAIVERMRMRELERAKRWQQKRQRREKLENDKIMKLIEEEKEKLHHQELLKKLKLEELKKKRMEKIQHEKHLEEIRQKFQQLNLKALHHYNRKLLRKGLQCFTNELFIKAALETVAGNHHNKVLTLRMFNEWKIIAHNIHERRIYLAIRLHQESLMKSYFQNFCQLQREYILNKQAAIDFYEMKTQEAAFTAWNQYTCDMMVEMNFMLEIADMSYKKNLLQKSFHCWKKLSSVLESERARERIKNSFHLKVLEIFPDFCPQIEDNL